MSSGLLVPRMGYGRPPPVPAAKTKPVGLRQ
jgi:hypothetical protein